MNNAAMNVGVQMSQDIISFPLDIYSEVELLDNSIDNFFLMNLHTGFHSGLNNLHSVRILFSPHPRRHSPSSLFHDSHSNKCEVISHCGFDLHFPDE